MPVSLKALIRYLLIFIIAFGVVYLAPFAPKDSSQNALVPAVVIFSLLIAFLINRAIERKHALATSIGIELSRLRRVNHLAESVGDGVWKKQVRDALTHYETKLGENFLGYAQMLGAFRGLTHLVYRYDPKSRHEELIVGDLLRTASDLALERQRIEQNLARHLSWYSWLVVATIAFFVIVLFFIGRTAAPWSIVNAGMGCASVLLVLDLLARIDRISPKEVSVFEKMYQKNISKSRE